MKAAFGDQRFDALIEIRYRHGVCMIDEYSGKAYDDHLPQTDHCFRAVLLQRILGRFTKGVKMAQKINNEFFFDLA